MTGMYLAEHELRDIAREAGNTTVKRETSRAITKWETRTRGEKERNNISLSPGAAHLVTPASRSMSRVSSLAKQTPVMQANCVL